MNVADEAMIQEAKIKARWAYLEKREREQLQVKGNRIVGCCFFCDLYCLCCQALRDQLRDEKELFSGEKLTQAERRIYEMNEKILALAEQRVDRKVWFLCENIVFNNTAFANQVEDGGYQIPDA
jgi:hypothetical protein